MDIKLPLDLVHAQNWLIGMNQLQLQVKKLLFATGLILQLITQRANFELQDDKQTYLPHPMI